MAGTAYQGTSLIGKALDEDVGLNDSMQYSSVWVHWNWNQPYVQCEPEKFSRRMTNEFTYTFTEEKTETNAENFFVHIVYKITK